MDRQLPTNATALSGLTPRPLHHRQPPSPTAQGPKGCTVILSPVLHRLKLVWLIFRESNSVCAWLWRPAAYHMLRPFVFWHPALVTLQATYFQRVVSALVDLPGIVLVVPLWIEHRIKAYQAFVITSLTTGLLEEVLSTSQVIHVSVITPFFAAHQIYGQPIVPRLIRFTAGARISSPQVGTLAENKGIEPSPIPERPSFQDLFVPCTLLSIFSWRKTEFTIPIRYKAYLSLSKRS